MGQQPPAKLDVTIRIQAAHSSRFDEIVRALEQAGLTEVQPHARFLLVNGSSNAVRLEALRQVDGVASVRVDQRYGPAGG